MSYQLRYSSRSLKEYIQLLEYIQDKFGVKKSKEVDTQLQETIKQILINPQLYPATELRSRVRRCVFSKQTSIYYRIKDNIVEIASIRDNRMNPKTLNI